MLTENVVTNLALFRTSMLDVLFEPSETEFSEVCAPHIYEFKQITIVWNIRGALAVFLPLKPGRVSIPTWKL